MLRAEQALYLPFGDRPKHFKNDCAITFGLNMHVDLKNLWFSQIFL